MPHTMTAERFAHVVASILNGDQSNGYNADARLVLAELDAERSAHAETKARLALAEKWAAFGSACFDAFWSDGDPCDLDAGDTQERALAHGVLRHRTEGDDTLDVDANNCCGFCPCVTDNAPLSECECLFPTLAAWRAAK